MKIFIVVYALVSACVGSIVIWDWVGNKLAGMYKKWAMRRKHICLICHEYEHEHRIGCPNAN